MQVSRSEDLSEYYEVLRESADEAQALLSDLLISVTTFFRDHDAFEALRTQVLPGLFEGRELDATIRVWVSGCATGEEAYSIAMLLQEEAAKQKAERLERHYTWLEGKQSKRKASRRARRKAQPTPAQSDP